MFPFVFCHRLAFNLLWRPANTCDEFPKSWGIRWREKWPQIDYLALFEFFRFWTLGKHDFGWNVWCFSPWTTKGNIFGKWSTARICSGWFSFFLSTCHVLHNFFLFNNMQRLKCEMWSYFPLSFKERKQNESCCKLLFPFSALCNLILVAPVKCNHINQHLI